MFKHTKAQEHLLKLSKDPKIVAFYEALGKLDGYYLNRAAAAMRRDFIWLCYRRHENTEMHNLVLHNLLSVYDGVARYLDGEGLNTLMPFKSFINFPFQAASPCMSAENDLFTDAGMHPEEVIHFWKSVDEHKKKILPACAEGFRFQDAVLPNHLGYLGPREGNSWYSRLIEGVAGIVLIPVNIVAAGATTAASLGLAAPIAAPLAVASVAAGVIAVGDAVTNVSGLHNP